MNQSLDLKLNFETEAITYVMLIIVGITKIDGNFVWLSRTLIFIRFKTWQIGSATKLLFDDSFNNLKISVNLFAVNFYLMILTREVMLANGPHLVWYCSMAILDCGHFHLVAKLSLECVSKQKSKV